MIKIVPKSEVIFPWPPSPLIAILFGGDRWSCVDEAVVAEEDGRMIGLASIAPEGEMNSGQPTIVGVYVEPAARGRGIGRQVFLAAIDRCIERELVPVRVDCISTGMAALIVAVLPERPGVLDVHECGMLLDY